MVFDIHVENIVASVALNARIDLDKVSSQLEEMEYEPEQFPGIVYRIKKPRAAALIFSSGKIVCTGARNLEDVKKVIKKVVSIIRKSGIKIPRDYTLEVENIVASAKFNAKLNLDTIAFNLENSEYEPEQFPGLVYRMDSPKVAFLLFGSGKVICTGGRSLQDVKAAVEKVHKRLKSVGAIKEN